MTEREILAATTIARGDGSLLRDDRGCSIRSVATARVRLRVEAQVTRRLGRDTWPLGARLLWVAGQVHGRLEADDGAELVLDGAVGWAEDLRARW